MKLYSHPSSSCSLRVLLALNLKGLNYECINITSFQYPESLEVNPMGYVPALVDGTTTVSDSYAILLYLEEKYPQQALLPQDLMKKTINYQVASIVSSSIQPLQNTNVVNYIGEIVSPDEKLPWAQYHIRKGFVALEKLLVNYAGKYATGDEIYLADLYLAPQIYNAIYLYKLDMAPTRISGLKMVSFSNSGRSNLPMSFRRLQVSCAAKPETVDKVCGIVRKQLALKDDVSVTGESKFASLGADSLDTVEIVMGLEEEFGITVEEESAQSIATVQDAADLIEKLVDKSA